MPVIRIEVPKGTADATQVAVRIAVREAVLKTLAPKETKYDQVTVREVIAEISDGARLIEVDLRPGREPARKKGAGRRHCGDTEFRNGVAEEDIYVLFRETPFDNHYTGGTPLPAWVPTDV